MAGGRNASLELECLAENDVGLWVEMAMMTKMKMDAAVSKVRKSEDTSPSVWGKI